MLGLFLAALAVFFLMEPVVAGATLGIGFIEPYGLAALRGDLVGFFGAAAFSCFWAPVAEIPNI
jgi:hypothetical protein